MDVGHIFLCTFSKLWITNAAPLATVSERVRWVSWVRNIIEVGCSLQVKYIVSYAWLTFLVPMSVCIPNGNIICGVVWQSIYGCCCSQISSEASLCAQATRHFLVWPHTDTSLLYKWNNCLLTSFIAQVWPSFKEIEGHCASALDNLDLIG